MPILDSRKLLAFVTLVKVGSFTLAAKELNVTQSAVSHSIKSLEDELQLTWSTDGVAKFASRLPAKSY